MPLLHFAFKSMPIFIELNDQIVMIGTPTGCPNKFGIMFYSSKMFASEASIVYKKSLYFAPKNCFFSLFSEL